MRATKLITLFFLTRESDNNIRSETPLTCSSRRNSTYRNPSHTNSDACGRKRGTIGAPWHSADEAPIAATAAIQSIIQGIPANAARLVSAAAARH